MYGTPYLSGDRLDDVGRSAPLSEHVGAAAVAPRGSCGPCRRAPEAARGPVPASTE